MIPSDVNVGLCEYEGMADLEAAWSSRRVFSSIMLSRRVHLLRLLLESGNLFPSVLHASELVI